MSNVRIRFDQVSKRFRRGESATALRDLLPNLVRRLRRRSIEGVERDYWALRDVSFEVRAGEVLGVIGANGAGKSTTLKLVAGILRPNGGRIEVNGSLSALIEVAAGFHPDLTGRENIYLNGSILGLPRRVVRERENEIIDFAELRDFIDTPVKRYSTGMYMRLGFAVAVHVDPDILLIDEVLAVGDLAFRQKCVDRIRRLKQADKTIMFVSHKMQDVRGICDRVIYLKDGRIHRHGSAREVSREYESDMRSKNLLDIVGRSEGQRGEGAVRITHVAVRDPDGNPIDVLPHGEKAIVSVRFEADQPVRHPRLSVSLLGSDGLRVCHVSSATCGPDVAVVSGACAFEVEFEELLLREDHYTVETVVWNAEMSVPLAQYRNPVIRIVGDRVPLTRPGVFQPPTRFLRVESEGSPTPEGG